MKNLLPFLVFCAALAAYAEPEAELRRRFRETVETFQKNQPELWEAVYADYTNTVMLADQHPSDLYARATMFVHKGPEFTTVQKFAGYEQTENGPRTRFETVRKFSESEVEKGLERNQMARIVVLNELLASSTNSVGSTRQDLSRIAMDLWIGDVFMAKNPVFEHRRKEDLIPSPFNLLALLSLTNFPEKTRTRAKLCWEHFSKEIPIPEDPSVRLDPRTIPPDPDKVSGNAMAQVDLKSRDDPRRGVYRRAPPPYSVVDVSASICHWQSFTNQIQLKWSESRNVLATNETTVATILRDCLPGSRHQEDGSLAWSLYRYPTEFPETAEVLVLDMATNDLGKSRSRTPRQELLRPSTMVVEEQATNRNRLRRLAFLHFLLNSYGSTDGEIRQAVDDSIYYLWYKDPDLHERAPIRRLEDGFPTVLDDPVNGYNAFRTFLRNGE